MEQTFNPARFISNRTRRKLQPAECRRKLQSVDGINTHCGFVEIDPFCWLATARAGLDHFANRRGLRWVKTGNGGVDLRPVIT